MSATGPRGIRNNNPGNIRRDDTAWVGLAADQADPDFFAFTEAVWGLRAILRIIHSYEGRGLTTVRGWITAWAPPSDGNDTDAYIAAVAAAVGGNPDATLSIESACVATAVLAAITQEENGEQPYGPDVLACAYALAFPRPSDASPPAT
jgi:hypothetical protein